MEKRTYQTPELSIVNMDAEGVLCASQNDVVQDFNNGLQDYDPSEGAW